MSEVDTVKITFEDFKEYTFDLLDNIDSFDHLSFDRFEIEEQIKNVWDEWKYREEDSEPDLDNQEFPDASLSILNSPEVKSRIDEGRSFSYKKDQVEYSIGGRTKYETIAKYPFLFLILALIIGGGLGSFATTKFNGTNKVDGEKNASIIDEEQQTSSIAKNKTEYSIQNLLNKCHHTTNQYNQLLGCLSRHCPDNMKTCRQNLNLP